MLVAVVGGTTVFAILKCILSNAASGCRIGGLCSVTRMQTHAVCFFHVPIRLPAFLPSSTRTEIH